MNKCSNIFLSLFYFAFIQFQFNLMMNNFLRFNKDVVKIKTVKNRLKACVNLNERR